MKRNTPFKINPNINSFLLSKSKITGKFIHSHSQNHTFTHKQANTQKLFSIDSSNFVRTVVLLSYQGSKIKTTYVHIQDFIIHVELKLTKFRGKNSFFQKIMLQNV